METIQSIMFDRRVYNLNKCLAYLRMNRMKKTDMWATTKYFHFPQYETNEFQNYYTSKMYNGVYLVKGYVRLHNDNFCSSR
jgi:hypothetical protein